MLIRLTSNTSGELVMLAKHLRRLFEIIGKECTARGVFTFEQLPPALASLQQAVDEEKLAARLLADEERAGKNPEKDADHDADCDNDVAVERQAEARVSLGQRARPLINLMEWTVKEKGFILWEAESDF